MTIHRIIYFICFGALFFLFPLPSHAGNKLVKTPSDYEGPFYPIIRQQDEDNNLIHVAGRKQAAQGDILHLSGKVVDENGQPFSMAVVEIWQTDPHGRYKDQRDRSEGKRDPDFQYWGKATTSADGAFSFTTLVPGDYNPRPAHIHFKVWIDGKLYLTSQMYFRNLLLGMEEGVKQSDTNKLQTVDLHKKDDGNYTAFFQIVL